MYDRSKIISEVIEKSGYSYPELAKLTGISKSSLQRYATGETKKIPLDCIEAIARVTNVSPAYLMGWTADFVSETEKSSSHDSRREALRKTLESLSDESLIELQEYIKYLIWKEKQAQHKRE